MSGFFNKILGKDIASRVQAIQYLGNMDSSESIPKLIKALDDDAPEIRRAAVIALEQHSRTGDKDAIIALTKTVNDADAGVRKSAAMTLGSFITRSNDAAEREQAKKELIRRLEKESDQSVIKGIVVALANIQDTALIGPMAEAFKTKDKKVITMAIDAINDLPSTDVRLDMKKALRSVL
jgi:HEAT repeat protein